MHEKETGPKIKKTVGIVGAFPRKEKVYLAVFCEFAKYYESQIFQMNLKLLKLTVLK